ncbi:MAG: hypothetical protein DI534_07000 [Leifsonia xyli]|nr:MAG: hypothetical protein DI534_07000 [Leifsonia xyli]
MSVLFAHDFTSTTARNRRLQTGAIVALARGVWTDQVSDEPAVVVMQHWQQIVAALLPGAVVTDRSAFDVAPVGGRLFVSHARTTPLVLPGLTVYPDGKRDTGAGGVDTFRITDGPLFGVNRTRALIDNAEQRGRPSAVPRRLSESELHERVTQIVTTSTASQVRNMIADVTANANRAAASRIVAIIEAAQGLRVLPTESRALDAAQRNEPYDNARAALFRGLAAAIQDLAPVVRPVIEVDRAAHVPFYEAYFSNYIEGSTLNVDEARRVIFERADVGKPADAHDMRATWEIVADVEEMRRSFATADEFMDTLRDRHRGMMAARPDTFPGMWKVEPNRAGGTVFVEPRKVVGTLRAGWEEGQVLTDPFQRALYAMFLVSEVHPFADGNGRSARVAMNAELVGRGHHRIIVPTIIRNEYLSGLARATAGNGPETLHRVLDHAQKWVAQGEFGDLDSAEKYLRVTNALVDSGVASELGLHLRVLRIGELAELDDQLFPVPPPAGAQRSLLGAVLEDVDG